MLVTKILAVLVALEFFYIFYLETIVPTSKTTGRVFTMSQEELNHPKVKVLLKNQGVYNGAIALMILYAAFLSAHTAELLMGLYLYIIVVAAYGSISSDRTILVKQGGLAIIAFLLLLFL